MKRNIIVLTSSTLLIILGFVAYLYYFNLQSSEEESSYQQTMDSLKVEQTQKEEQFYKEKEEKNKRLIERVVSENNQDQDGDGLTYAEELSLGTDDTNPDSDGDGISDKEDLHPAGGGENYKFSVNWQHVGYQWTTQFGIPEDTYSYYKNKARGYCCDGWEQFATPNDLTIKTIAEDITDVVRTKGSQPLYAAIDFVESMTYQYDIDFNNNAEYPKFAIETIIDQRGDCEDTSFLMASILEALNVDTVIFLLPGHAAVGVYCEDCSGKYYVYNGRKYYFLETTGASGSWEIGRTSYDLDTQLNGIIDV